MTTPNESIRIGSVYHFLQGKNEFLLENPNDTQIVGPYVCQHRITLRKL